MIMPIKKKPDYPEWNPKNKLESLKVFGKFLHHTAKDVFLEDERFKPLIFTFMDEGVGKAMYTVDPDQTPEEISHFIKERVQEDKLYAIIHSGIGTRYMQGKQREALVVSIQSRDGFFHIYVDEIERKGKQVSFGYGFEEEGVDPILGKVFE